MYLLKDKDGRTAWHVAAKWGKVELFEILWDWAKELQLNPEEIKNDVYLLKDKNETTAWHVAAKWGIVELFERL